jgi:hypothetical protein
MAVAIALTALSALLLLVAWTLLLSGFGRPRAMAPDGTPGTTGRARPSPARQDDRETTTTEAPGALDMAGFKRLLLGGEWQRVLPSLLLIAGMLGIMFFGAISLLFVLEQKSTGILMLLVAIAAAAKLARDFQKA